jgi:phosphatidate cytidylyltransferase
MILQRIISGALLAGSMLAVILFAPQPAVAAMLAVLYLIGAWEWAGLTSLKGGKRIAYVIVVAALMLTGWLLHADDGSNVLLWLAASAWLGIVVWLSTYHRQKSHAAPRWHTPLMGLGLLLIPAAWLALVKLDGLHYGWLIYTMALCAFADSFAFLAGKQFGRHKLAPELSPGKTVEGLIGGMLSVLMLSLAVAWWLKMPGAQVVSLVLLSLFCGLISVVGDLFESLLKREAGQKDSGRILPGHGGVLDRFDSHISVAPFFYLGLRWIS